MGDARCHRYHHRASDTGAGVGDAEREGGLSMSWQEDVAATVVLLGIGAGAAAVPFVHGFRQRIGIPARTRIMAVFSIPLTCNWTLVFEVRVQFL